MLQRQHGILNVRCVLQSSSTCLDSGLCLDPGLAGMLLQLPEYCPLEQLSKSKHAPYLDDNDFSWQIVYDNIQQILVELSESGQTHTKRKRKQRKNLVRKEGTQADSDERFSTPCSSMELPGSQWGGLASPGSRGQPPQSAVLAGETTKVGKQLQKKSGTTQGASQETCERFGQEQSR